MRFFKNHSATLLTIGASAGVIFTAIAASKSTLKASEILKDEELKTIDKIKIVAPNYIFPILFGASTIACIVGANILNKHQQTALASAYALLNCSYEQYKTKVKEIYGDDAHNNIISSIAKEECKDVSFEKCYQEIDEYSEPRLFYDDLSKRYFETSIEQVLLAEYNLNRNYILRGYATLNEFYDFLGLKPTDYGDIFGWSIKNGKTKWIDFNHNKAIIDDDLECYIIEMKNLSKIKSRK